MVKAYRYFLTEQWPLLIFGFLTVFWGNFGQTFFVSWFGASIQSSLGLSAGDYGAIYSLATLASGVAMFWIGTMVDRWTLPRFSLFMALTLMAACVSMALTTSVFFLACSFFLLRLSGQGMLPHTAQAAMLRYFPLDRGKALSISTSGFPVGEVMLPLLVVALIAGVGWRYTWWLLALTVALLYLPLQFWLLRRAQHQITLPDAGMNAGHRTYRRREILLEPRFLLILPAVLVNPLLVSGTFIQQPFLLSYTSWSASWFAASFIAFGVLHWMVGMLAGSWVDRFQARHLLPFVLLPQALAMLSLIFLHGQWLAWVFMSLLGCAVGVAGPVNGALWAEMYGTQQIGMVRSLISSLLVFASAAAPWIFGTVIDTGLLGKEIYSGCLLFTVVAALLSWLAFPPKGFSLKGKEPSVIGSSPCK